MPASDFIDHVIDNAATITASGTSAVFVIPPNVDRREHKGVFIVSVGGVSGTSPNLSYQVQASLDGVLWFNVGGSISFTAAGSNRIEFVTAENYYQVVRTVTGTTPSFTNVNSHVLYLK